MISKSICFGLLMAICVVHKTFGQTSVDINLSARELPPMDIFDGPPDPYVVVYYSAKITDPFIKIGETRYYDDVWQADWPETFYFTYNSVVSQQRLKFDVMDYDWDENDQIGYVEVYLSDLVNSFGNILDKPIIGSKNQGILTLKGRINATGTIEDMKSPQAKAVPLLVHHAIRDDPVLISA